MKKTFPALVAVLLALLMILSGCGRVTQKLDELFPEETESPTVTEDPLTASMPDRELRTYVVLLATQAETAENLSTVSLLTFDTEKKSVHWLQIPANLFVHSSGNTLAGAFSAAYQLEAAQSSATPESAAVKGIDIVRKLLSDGFNVPIDYYVNFAPDQLSSLIGTLEGIPVKFTDAIAGFGAGEHTLDADSVRRYISYNDYADPTNDRMEARTLLAGAIWRQAGKVITTENLSLYSTQLRGQMTTDIPYDGGEDIFFLRRFLQAESEDFKITHISTQSVIYSNTQCQVMIKDNALRQLNEQMEIYEEELTPQQFDPSLVFADYSNALVQTVYTSSSKLPTLYTMADLDPDKPVVEESPSQESE